MNNDPFQSCKKINSSGKDFAIYSLPAFSKQSGIDLNHLPFSIRILLENLLRKYDGKNVTREDVLAVANWGAADADRPAVPFYPGRVVMQDFTGVPVIVDLAAMRSAVAKLGGDPSRINPVIPVDLVIDHSLQVDAAGLPDAMRRNVEREYERNRERYEFLRWGQQAFENLRIVPPSSGIIHQVNLEYLAGVVLTGTQDGQTVAYPDSLVGSDSHTTMINGLGVLGWGVGGIEATAAMLGQPLDLVLPDVIGIRLSGSLREGVTPTDLTLTLTQLLRKIGVVNKFIEYFGPGLSSLSLADRAMVANMTPENGSTMGFFPVDEQTLAYLRLSGRSEAQVALVEAYTKAQGLFRTDDTPAPAYTQVVELDLGSIEPSLAGPRRPQDRVALGEVKKGFTAFLSQPKPAGLGLEAADAAKKVTLSLNQKQVQLGHGAVVIAAITSCTNTSDPFVMLGAGLLAKKALARGLRSKPWVKTSLTPGSRVVTAYLEKAGLVEPLAELGFTLAGYGCATCIGNSGPLAAEIEESIKANKLAVAAVISGNRNFEGRVHPLVQANYLASPALVVAYALAGSTEIDLTSEPLGMDAQGQPVYLRDIWPTSAEINAAIAAHVTPELYKANYADLFKGDEEWQSIQSQPSVLYAWRADSSYIQEPPFFDVLFEKARSGATPPMRVLAFLGDSVTTDHISPAGDIPSASAAGQYLKGLGVVPIDFNSYGSRRGNYQVLTRGTLANIRIKNKLVPGVEGSVTLHLPDGAQMSLYDAAMKYKSEGTPLILLAGKEYGTGSSRDWAAKGPLLLGVKAVLAESFERIHRSNLVGMGVLPLTYLPGENAESLGLTGLETFEIEELEPLAVKKLVTIRAYSDDCKAKYFKAQVCINTPSELEYFGRGGLLPSFVKGILEE